MFENVRRMISACFGTLKSPSNSTPTKSNRESAVNELATPLLRNQTLPEHLSKSKSGSPWQAFTSSCSRLFASISHAFLQLVLKEAPRSEYQQSPPPQESSLVSRNNQISSLVGVDSNKIPSAKPNSPAANQFSSSSLPLFQGPIPEDQTPELRSSTSTFWSESPFSDEDFPSSQSSVKIEDQPPESRSSTSSFWPESPFSDEDFPSRQSSVKIDEPVKEAEITEQQQEDQSSLPLANAEKITDTPGAVAHLLKAPRGIPNYGNQCYRIASNQALRALEPYRMLMDKPCPHKLNETDEGYRTREIIRQSILGLYETLEGDQEPDPELLEAFDYYLLHAIAESGLAPDLLDETDLYTQQDASTYVELVFGTLFNEVFEMKKMRSAKINGQIIQRAFPSDTFGVLQVALTEDVKGLQQMVDLNFGNQKIHDPDNEWKVLDGHSTVDYEEDRTLTGEPKQVLPIQLKRFSYGGRGVLKVDKSIEFPADNILDMSKAYGRPPGSVTYSLQSFVCHLGQTPTHGHYISYVKKGDQWYCCNDDKVTAVTENIVDQAKSKAYLLFFEKNKGTHETQGT